MGIKETIRKYALQNAVRYDGKANPGNIIGKVIGENPELKTKGKELMKDIQQIVREINKLSVEEQTKQLQELAPEMLEKKAVEKEVLKQLKNAENGKVVMRFAPSPSGPMHIGHSYALSLNSEYCRKYKGKLILRIEDTNPENIYPPAYEMIPEEAKWITKGNIAWVYIQSERMDIYYKRAEEVIRKGHAYVCTCPAEKFREMKIKRIPCPCRTLKPEENLQRWKKMFKEYKEGDAVLRIKTNINDPNPAMRDWPAFRINESEHPRQKKKYKVWPLMNFAVAVDDKEMGVTHALRAKDHMDNEKRQKFLYDHMGWKIAETIYVGKINFEDLMVKCSKTKPLIEKGDYTGWDDIRLPFLAALSKRGYQPDAFINYALGVGVTQNDKTVSKQDFFKSLDHFNRAVIEPNAYRYFFVESPAEIKIEKAPEQEIELDLHPENKKGGRKFKTNDKFYIDKSDLKQLKEGKLYRLMDCLNFVKKKGKFVFDSTDYEKFKKKGDRIIHWLPVSKDLVHVAVRMDDNFIKKGLGESSMSKLKKGDIVQLERFAFARLESKDDSRLEFWFTHH
ncbi:glutamate--tRNA ligase [Candidatus Woesearchaeota archaeon]|nr:glutamate--tRNA ligase [Candidatus Woesearchaeota archaeon]